MITYRPFWDFLKAKNISTYMLIYTYGINSYTIDRLRHDKPLKTTTIDSLCTMSAESIGAKLDIKA